MKRILSNLANFLRDKNFRTFALNFAIAYFFQMYAKFGYIISKAMFPENEALAWASGLLFGLFAGTATTAVIVHNKEENAKISTELLWSDIIISGLFYFDVTLKFWKDEKYGAMLAILMFAYYTSRLLYFLSEQFRKDNVEDNKLIAENRAQNQSIKDLLTSWHIVVPQGKETVADMMTLLQSSYENAISATKVVQVEAEMLRHTAEEVGNLTTRLQNATEEREQHANMLREYSEKLRQERQENQTMKDKIEELQEEVGKYKNTRELASQKGQLQKLVVVLIFN